MHSGQKESQSQGEPAATAKGPLDGIRVLDLTTVVMGPAATQVLGDLGADIVKIEQPGGDSLRRIGPARHDSMGPMFLQANRNKKSVMLDLKQAEDRERLLELAREADVLVSNVRPQAMKRLRLDYETVASTNPSIVYCSTVGYGSDGPNAGQAVYDDLIQAASGISGLFERVDGTPRYAPVNICDRVVGLYAAIAVLAALNHRATTGEGQQIEVPMFETMAQFVTADHMAGAAFVPPVGPMGYNRLLSRTRGPYPTKDGYLSLVVYTDADWRRFGALIGQPDVIDRNPAFSTQTLRTRNAEEVGRFLGTVLGDRTTAEWIELLRGIDIPCSPVNGLEDLFDDPHLKAVGLFSEADHPTEGRVKVSRFPVKFGRTPASIRSLAPNLGEHNDAVDWD